MVGLCLFRIAQEALQNVKKHAGGAKVEVRLALSEGTVVLTICDNGPGFDRNRISAQHGLGLLSMEERARLVGGVFRIDSLPGLGTKLTVEVPLALAGQSNPPGLR